MKTWVPVDCGITDGLMGIWLFFLDLLTNLQV